MPISTLARGKAISKRGTFNIMPKIYELERDIAFFSARKELEID
jgi:hypothetical protein